MNFRFAKDGTLTAKAALVRLREDLSHAGADLHWPRGVVGAFDPRSQVLYGYPEIAGYWLRWASARADVGDRCGNLVLTWLIRQYAHNHAWPTRVAAHKGGVSAEYARASYLFDHVMLWDGLKRWGTQRHSADAIGLAQLVWDSAQAFVVNGQLEATRGATNNRWSSRLGPFLLKVCARARDQKGPLAEACELALPILRKSALERPHDEAHPQFYAIEGLIELGLIDDANKALDQLLGAHGGVLRVRETLDGGPRRSDVLAQLLRAGCLLGRARPGAAEWSALAAELVARIDARGRLSFAGGSSEPRPTWAALFAEQALSLWLDGPNPATPLV